jgi:flagellar biogenesis protein FliO
MANDSGLMWTYMGSFTLWTLGIIALMYGVTYALKRWAGISGPVSSSASSSGLPRKLPASLTSWFDLTPIVRLIFPTIQPHSQQNLRIESSLMLEPRKKVYILQAGDERFLVGSSLDGLQMLSRLTDATPDNTAIISSLASPSHIPGRPVINPPPSSREATDSESAGDSDCFMSPSPPPSFRQVLQGLPASDFSVAGGSFCSSWRTHMIHRAKALLHLGG